MWISIRTKRVPLSPRARQKMEAFVRRSFERERRYIGSVVVGIEPAKRGGDLGYDCRIAVWSHYLGLLVVTDSGDTIRTAVQPAIERCRETFRRRIEKRRSKTRRMKRNRLPHWLAAATAEE